MEITEPAQVYLLGMQMAAVKTKTPKAPTGVRRLLQSLFCSKV